MPRPSKPWFRRQTGWWMCTFHGKKRKLARGIANRKLAKQRFHQLMALEPQSFADDASVGMICRAFLRWSKRHHAADTYRNHKFYVGGFRKRYGRMPVSRLTKNKVTTWVDTHNWNDTSQYNARRSVFRAFNWAVEEDLLAENPLKGMKRTKPAPRQRAMTEQEYSAMLQARRGPFRTLLFSLWNTGARPSELRGLKWPQVEADRLVLAEHKTVKQTGKARIIQLNRPMQRLLRFLRQRAKSEYVFLNRRSKPWTCNAVRLNVARLKKKLNLADDLCVYLTRHAFGTNAILRGVDVATTAQLMGHSSLEMISKVYCHLADKQTHLQDAVERVTRPSPTA